jgi:uncharacterized protein (UPF0212 family)
MKSSTLTNQAVLEAEMLAPLPTIGLVYCPICTHTVKADVVAAKRGHRVVSGQKCPRCNSTLDAGFVVRTSLY